MKGHRRILIKRNKSQYHKLTPRGTGPKTVRFHSEDIQVEVYGKDLVQFGRDADFSDALLFVEPILPLEEHPENVEKSLRISSAHFVITQEEDEFVIKDTGSVNGTMLNGQSLTRPLSLKAGDQIDVANVLKLRVEAHQPALLIARMDNEPSKFYLLLPTNSWVPFNLGSPRSSANATLVFCAEGDALFLGNQSGALSIEQHTLEEKEASCLSGKAGVIKVNGVRWSWTALD